LKADISAAVIVAVPDWVVVASWLFGGCL